MSEEPLFTTCESIGDADTHPAAVRLPQVGQRWHWRPDLPHASVVVLITEVKWNGEEWWITSDAVEGQREVGTAWNDLELFMESAVLICDDDDE